jgi:CheY-like chemotaxis protein
VDCSGAALDAPVILVVDDEPSIRTLIGAALRAQGYRVLQAADGLQALDLAARGRPSLVLLDIALPLLSGHDVLRRLRQTPATASTPVLLLSGLASSLEEEQARGLGAQGVIGKPFTPAELLRRVAQALPQPVPAPR